MKKALLGLLVISIITVSCSKSSTSPEYSADCSGAAKSFSRDVSPVIQGTCVGCHSNYGSYSGITRDKASIRSTIINGTMPEKITLTATQKNDVICWIDNGAPNN